MRLDTKTPIKKQVRDGGIMLLIISLVVFFLVHALLGAGMFAVGLAMALGGAFASE